MSGLLIGELAARGGVSPATIRYYEAIGLLPPPLRSAAGYRRYGPSAVDELRFIRKAQALGFSLDEIREILAMAREGQAACDHVLALARRHLAALEERIAQLERFRAQLAGAVDQWDGVESPSCEGLCQIITSAEPDPAIVNVVRPPLGSR